MSKFSLLLKNTLLFNIVFFSFLITAQEIEEVVVTATKKEESLQDVAISVEAFGSEDIVEQQIFDMSDSLRPSPHQAESAQMYIFSASHIGFREHALGS